MEFKREQQERFLKVISNHESTGREVAEALLNFDVLLIGASQINEPVKIEGTWYGRVAGYKCEGNPGYINVFTDEEVATAWQRHYGRPLGVLYKKDNFNSVFEVAYMSGVPNVWVNEGSEYGVRISTKAMTIANEKTTGNMLFASIGDDVDVSNGLQIRLDSVKCEMIGVEAD